MTIKELIKELEKYPEYTSVCGGIKTSKSRWYCDLSIKETHPIGDGEDTLLLWIGWETDEFTLETSVKH